MGVGIGGEFIASLLQIRMMGIPVFFIILVMAFGAQWFFNQKISWLSSAYRLPETRPPTDVEKSWFHFLQSSLRFIRTAIQIGLAGWILLGITLLFAAGLIICRDLMQMLSSHSKFSLNFVSANLVPIVIGLLLAFSGSGLIVYLRKNLQGDTPDGALNSKSRFYWYAILAVLSVILLFLRFTVMGILFGFISFYPLARFLVNMIRDSFVIVKREDGGEGDGAEAKDAASGKS
jgi:hypothetical protein